MTLQQFFDKWNNQFCEVVDPSNPNQCFDLAIAYTDALGNPRIFNFLYASQIYTSFGSTQAQYYDRIPNSVTAVPKAGDIVVWGGTVGHVAIATGKGDTNSFESFDQNYPTGSKCHYQTHNYDNPPVLGWLRPKKGLDQPIVDDCPAKLTQVTQERDRLNKVIEGKDQTIGNLNTTINDKNNQITKLTSDVSTCTTTSANLTERIASLTEQSLKVKPLEDQVSELERQKKLWKELEDGYRAKIKKSDEDWAAIKLPYSKLLKKLLIDRLG